MASRFAPTRHGRLAGWLLLAALAAPASALAQTAPPPAATGQPDEPEAGSGNPFPTTAAPAAQAAPAAGSGNPFQSTNVPAVAPAAVPPAGPSNGFIAGIRETPVAPSLEPAEPALAPTEPAPPAAPALPAVTPAEAPAPAPPASPPAAPPPTAVVALDHPTLLDTATLESPSAQKLPLFGIVGLPGPYADGLKGYIAAGGDHLTCQPREHAEYVCLLDDGTDIAMAALINGAAQTRADAPDGYLSQQAEAQAARRGLWASLPPPPVPVAHPAVPDTATLVAGGQSYALDAVEGVGGDYARNMQGYIAANGDNVLCQPQGATGGNVCLLADGTDVAKVALVNGAARVAPDAPDDYRVQQADAINHRRGIWQGLTDAEAVVLLAPPPGYVLVPEVPLDGLLYIGGVPAAVIDGQTVFFAYADGIGWGYWDGDHHWQGAPGRFAGHLDHFHHEGAGLRGYGAHGGVALTAGAHPGAHPGAAAAGAPGAHLGAAGQPGGVHAGATGQAIPGRPAASGQAPARPGVPAQAAARPGPQGQPHTAPRPAATPFMRPTAPSGNAFAHAAPAAHAAPSVHAAHAPAPGCKSKC